MSIRIKLVVIILFVALVPLTISALTALRVHRKAFDDKIGEIHKKTAEFGARLAQSHLDTIRQTLKLATRSIRWAELSPAEREGAMWLVYRQLEDIAVVSLLDHAGEGIGFSVYVGEPTADPPGHPLAGMPLLQAFAKNIPFSQAKKKGVALSEVFLAQGASAPLAALAVSVGGQAPDTNWAVAIGISLRGLCRDVSKMGTAGLQVMLLDGQDRVICRSDGGATLKRIDPKLRFSDREGNRMLAAQATMPLGWTMVVRQPESIAFSASRRMVTQTIFWIGLSLIVALVAGLFLSRSISLPVRQLVLGASELAKGNFGFRLQLSSRDEFGRLSSTFNHMGAEIEKRDSEIQAWNRELLQRVEDRTRELKELQNELLQSKKIAAVSSMGAGIAHEINNPLTAVLGLTQVLLAQQSSDDPEMQETLESIEREAQRIKGIVQNMLKLAEDFAGKGFARLNLNEIMDESVSLLDWDREEERIEIVRDYAKSLPAVLGNSTNLCQVFMHLFNNSRTAMPDGGRLTLSTSVVEGQLVKAAIADTGKGIEPEYLEKILDPFFTTKDNWKSSGLGLTVAFRIVEEHRGKLRIDSTPDVGTTVTITMPAAGRGAHLR